MSCSDLILTDQPNYVIDFSTHPLLCKNCHHQCLVWNFKKSNSDAIKRAIELMNWSSPFSHKNVHE